MNIYSLPQYVRSCDLDKGYLTGATAKSPYTIKVIPKGMIARTLEVYSDKRGYIRLYLKDLMEADLRDQITSMFQLSVYARGTTTPAFQQSFQAVYCREPDPAYWTLEQFAETHFMSSAPDVKILADVNTLIGVECLNVLSTDVNESVVTYHITVEYVDEDGEPATVSGTFEAEPTDNMTWAWVKGLLITMEESYPELVDAQLKSMTVTAGKRTRTYYFTSEQGYTELCFQSDFGIYEVVQLPLEIEETSKMTGEQVVLSSGRKAVAAMQTEDHISASAFVDLPTALYLRRQLRSGNLFMRKCGSQDSREMSMLSMEVRIVDSRSAEVKFSFLQNTPGYIMPPAFSEALSPNRIFSRHFSSHFS